MLVGFGVRLTTIIAVAGGLWGSGYMMGAMRCSVTPAARAAAIDQGEQDLCRWAIASAMKPQPYQIRPNPVCDKYMTPEQRQHLRPEGAKG